MTNVYGKISYWVYVLLYNLEGKVHHSKLKVCPRMLGIHNGPAFTYLHAEAFLG